MKGNTGEKTRKTWNRVGRKRMKKRYTTTLKMDGIFSQRYKVIKIKRLLPSFQGQKPPSYWISDSWPSQELTLTFRWKIPRPLPRCSWMVCKRGQSPRYLRPFRSSNNGKFPANAPLCPGRGGAGAYIDWCITFLFMNWQITVQQKRLIYFSLDFWIVPCYRAQKLQTVHVFP